MTLERKYIEDLKIGGQVVAAPTKEKKRTLFPGRH